MRKTNALPARGRLARESRTMDRMVRLYCRAHHVVHGDAGPAPCARCREFLAYADRRLQKCPYGEDKPTCANCPVHCYKRAPREFARTMMRYSGPRMMLRHPWLALRHILDGRRKVEHPMALRRRRGRH